MQIDIITLLPDLLEGPLNHSIIQRAQEKGKLQINLINLRAYGIGNTNRVDDYPYGGAAGMLLMIEPVAKCIEELQQKNGAYDEIIYMAPDGELFDQPMANQIALHQKIIIICGHYKGIDERIRELFVTKEISIGSYVLSGGELAAAVLVDSIGRLIPGVLNDESSALFDSFQDNLLAPPEYTRPADYKGHKVPDVLLSGHTQKVEDWRNQQAYERTKERRPDLL